MLPERLLGLVSCVPADGVQNLVFEGLDHPQDPLSGSAPLKPYNLRGMRIPGGFKPCNLHGMRIPGELKPCNLRGMRIPGGLKPCKIRIYINVATEIRESQPQPACLFHKSCYST